MEVYLHAFLTTAPYSFTSLLLYPRGKNPSIHWSEVGWAPELVWIMRWRGKSSTHLLEIQTPRRRDEPNHGTPDNWTPTNHRCQSYDTRQTLPQLIIPFNNNMRSDSRHVAAGGSIYQNEEICVWEYNKWWSAVGSSSALPHPCITIGDIGGMVFPRAPCVCTTWGKVMSTLANNGFSVLNLVSIWLLQSMTNAYLLRK
jgi:hypothetical protein